MRGIYRVVRVRPKCWRIFYEGGLKAVDAGQPCRPRKLVAARGRLLNGDTVSASVLGDYGGAKIKYGKRFAQPR